MIFRDNMTQVISTASSVVVVCAMLVVGAGFVLGIGLDRPDQFFDVQHWVEAFQRSLKSF